MVPGFHCSSLEFHDVLGLIPKLSQMGFAAVAIQPRRGGWDFDAPWFDDYSASIAAVAAEHAVRIVVDLDGPFYNDIEHSESGSLAGAAAGDSGRTRQRLERQIRLAAAVCPQVITFSSGPTVHDSVSVSPAASDEAALEALAGAIEPLAKLAKSWGIALALRPVSGHAISTVAHFERFGQWLDADTSLGLAADVGEMLLGHEFPIGTRLARLQHRLTCVYLCEPDVERGCDQRFGHGDIDLGRVWEVIRESGFSGPAVFRACGHGRLGLSLARHAWTLVEAAGR